MPTTANEPRQPANETKQRQNENGFQLHVSYLKRGKKEDLPQWIFFISASFQRLQAFLSLLAFFVPKLFPQN